MQRGIVWVVDDDSSIRWVLERALAGAGLTCTTFENGAEVLEALASKTPDVLLSDIRMPGMDGLALLKQIKQRHPMLPVIIMTAHSDLDAAVSAYQQGAFDYLPKPFDIDEAVALVERAISHYQEQQQPRNIQLNGPTTDIIGEAPAMQDVFRIIGRLSRSSISVLINGESGTGKELVAHALHRHSPRAKAPFIALNMAAIPKDLIESEPFGHEKGAFTGANTIRQGRFEQADGGTLFLDEIGDMPLDVQTRLLRVLADGQFYRVGGYAPVKVDVRIIAATHQNLEQRVQEGKFREDLFHRLNVIRVHLPPLRERREDIPRLARHFLQVAAHELGVEAKLLHPETEAALTRLAWPGNVRQLENAIQRGMILNRDGVIYPDVLGLPETDVADRSELQWPVQPAVHIAETSDLGQHGRSAQYQYIADLMRKYQGNRSKIADLLGITPRALRYRLASMRKQGIEVFS